MFHRKVLRADFILNLNQLKDFFLQIILHRKEVIHPHLPVGIPCYDLCPVTGPILGGPLHYWLGYRLWILPTPMH